MMNNSKNCCLVIFIITLLVLIKTSQTTTMLNLTERTKFIFYDKNNKETSSKECYQTRSYAMIVHGLGESCETFWVKDLRRNLLDNRNGCVICMDYSDYNNKYLDLLTHFPRISTILLHKMIELRVLKFNSRDAYFFGFSYGSRLITRAAIEFGPKQIGTIHLCDIAGPGFDMYKTNGEPRMAAIHSQCFHTDAKNKGTTEQTCHQDWYFGDCGVTQIAAGPKPLGSHGLCPVFYNMAFKHKFMAIKKEMTCSEPLHPRDLNILPAEGIRMGYFQTNTHTLPSEVNLYVATKAKPPYC